MKYIYIISILLLLQSCNNNEYSHIDNYISYPIFPHNLFRFLDNRPNSRIFGGYNHLSLYLIKNTKKYFIFQDRIKIMEEYYNKDGYLIRNEYPYDSDNYEYKVNISYYPDNKIETIRVLNKEFNSVFEQYYYDAKGFVRKLTRYYFQNNWIDSCILTNDGKKYTHETWYDKKGIERGKHYAKYNEFNKLSEVYELNDKNIIEREIVYNYDSNQNYIGKKFKVLEFQTCGGDGYSLNSFPDFNLIERFTIDEYKKYKDSYKYFYDTKNRVIKAINIPENGITEPSYTYSYDEYGNIKTVEKYNKSNDMIAKWEYEYSK